MAVDAPRVGDRLRVLLEDGWEYGKIAKVATTGSSELNEDNKDENNASGWKISVQFDGEDSEEQEVYDYPDEDILLEREEKAFFSAMHTNNMDKLRNLLRISRHFVEAQEDLGGLPGFQQGCLHSNPRVLSLMCHIGGLDVNRVCSNGDRLVHLAVQHQRTLSLNTLIQYSANLSAKDAKGRQPLHIAASTGNVDVLNQLLRPYRDVSSFFQTVCGTVSEVSKDRTLLIDLDGRLDPPYDKVDPNSEEEKGKSKKKKKREREEQKNKGNRRTGLHIASLYGHAVFIAKLCAAGAKVNILDSNNRSPLHLAILHAKEAYLSVKTLLELKADVHIADKNGHTPFILSVMMRKWAEMELLYNCRGKDWHTVINRKDSKGHSPLAHAVRLGEGKIVSKLLEMKADPNTYDVGRVFPLHAATVARNTKIASILLKSEHRILDKETKYWYHVIEPLGARYFSCPSLKSPTKPRQGAKVGELLRIVKKNGGWVLLENKCWVPLTRNPDSKDYRKADSILEPFLHESPTDIKMSMTPPDLEGANFTNLENRAVGIGLETYEEANSGNNETVLKVHVDARDILGRTALHSAANIGDVSMGRLLLNHHADINARDHDGITPLYLAANESKESFVKMLLNREADYRIPRHDGWTPLHVSSAFSHLECVKLLLNAGANALSQDKYGSIPLHVVEAGKDKETAEKVANLLKSAMKASSS